jgi:hypothetical protein
VALLSTFILTLGVPGSVYAQTPHWVGISVAQPYQYPAATESIRGLRLNLLYTKHQTVRGVDLGLGINRVQENFTGIETALYNNVSENTTGFQSGLISVTEGDLNGAQISLANLSRGRTSGFQLGIANKAEIMHGVQIGLVNTAFELKGLQVGLLNMKNNLGTSPQSLPFRAFPLVNWSF